MVHYNDQYSRAWNSSDGAMNIGNIGTVYQPAYGSSSQPYPSFGRSAVSENLQSATLGGSFQEHIPLSLQVWTQPQVSFPVPRDTRTTSTAQLPTDQNASTLDVSLDSGVQSLLDLEFLNTASAQRTAGQPRQLSGTSVAIDTIPEPVSDSSACGMLYFSLKPVPDTRQGLPAG